MSRLWRVRSYSFATGRLVSECYVYAPTIGCVCEILGHPLSPATIAFLCVCSQETGRQRASFVHRDPFAGPNDIGQHVCVD